MVARSNSCSAVPAIAKPFTYITMLPRWEAPFSFRPENLDKEFYAEVVDEGITDAVKVIQDML